MKWFIPGNVPSSKNGRRWTGKYFVSSKAVVNYRKKTKIYYEQFAEEFKKEIAGRELPITVSFTFIRNSRRKFDYVNPLQTVQDDMVKYGWIEDDNADNLIPAFGLYSYDKENSGVIIELI